MRPTSIWSRLLVLLGVGLCLACAPKSAPDPQYAQLMEPGTRAPSGALEREILKRLPQWEPGRATSLEGEMVVVGAPYMAASGRHCRRVYIGKAPSQSLRLACESSDGWAFVPDVLPGAESS